MTAGAIHAAAVVKRYGAVTALDRVDLSVAPGERVALLGHNGAGKTTLIRLILGLARQDAGELTVMGEAPGSGAVRPHYAYLPESLAFHGALTGREQLAFFARLKGAAGGVEELLERVGLAEAMDRRIATYSKGMRQRLGLAQLLVGKPRIVVLDEPTTGLDPLSRHWFYEIVSELAAGGAAIVLSSHALTELEAQTEKIVILRKGRVVASGALAELRREASLPIRLKVRARPGRAGEIAQKLGGRPVNGSSVELQVTAAEKLASLRSITGMAGAIEDIDVFQPSLEDLYRHFGAAEAAGEETP